ncbi:MAG: hypothetical protein HC830_06825 [Bacteroidetes bacterium]|nr:hypothetical protein [Bacteroidota bacterium]
MKLSSLFVLFALSMHLCAQTSDSLKIKPRAIPAWTYWIPGASYYYQGKIVQGSIFMTLETGGIILGTIYDKNLKNNSASPYYNYPLLLGLQAFQTEKLSLFRNQLEIVKFKKPDFRYDNLSEKELYLAPFRLKISLPLLQVEWYFWRQFTWVWKNTMRLTVSAKSTKCIFLTVLLEETKE